MAKASDGKALTEAQICDLVGVSHQRRRKWVSRQLLRDAPRGGCRRHDALALAQVRRLIDVLGPTDGVAAWQQMRPALEAAKPEDQIQVLFDLELKQAELVHHLDSVGELIGHGRPVRLVPMTERRREIDAAFDRLCAAVQGPSDSAA